MATPDFDHGRAVFQLDPEAQERLGSRPIEEGTRSPSGVWIADDFRSNLIVDRYDPIFAAMRASKLKHLRSENSEDAVTWNAFRSLRQIDPERWLPELWERGLPTALLPDDRRALVRLWPEVEPPPALRALADEGATEADVIIESPSWVWFIEAKLRSDISPATTTRPDRDQILRNIDVGSYYAGVRSFHFSLLIMSPERTPIGVERLRAYQDPGVVRSALAGHRADGLQNLGSMGLLTWQDIGDVLASVGRSDARDDEKAFARRAADWLGDRRLWIRGLGKKGAN